MSLFLERMPCISRNIDYSLAVEFMQNDTRIGVVMKMILTNDI